MACYHPMVKVKMFKSNDKPTYKFMSLKTYESYVHEDNRTMIKLDQFACGQCIGCRLDYSRQWALRCMFEAQQYEHNYFVTLTYDNENVPYSKGVIDFKTGEVGDVMTLKKDELSNFMKNLRSYYKYNYNLDNIRFYGCGEYGSKNGRPHYHFIGFNLPIFDLKFWYTGENGTKIYTSEILSKIWNKGIVAIADVCWESCAYVARYVMKKVKGKGQLKDEFLDSGKVPEFSRMSRMPGIAREFYEKNKEKIYQFDEMIYKNKKGVFSVKPSRYFDKIYDIDEPDKMFKIKEKRIELAENTKNNKEEELQMLFGDILSIEEIHKLAQIKSLKRTV